MGADASFAFVRRRTEPVLIRKHAADKIARCSPLLGIARLAQWLEISMSLSSWIVFGLIAGFMSRRIVNQGRHHRRNSDWNRRWV
jgi:hypothetical protein